MLPDVISRYVQTDCFSVTTKSLLFIKKYFMWKTFSIAFYIIDTLKKKERMEKLPEIINQFKANISIMKKPDLEGRSIDWR